jgi:hypothetical protein
MPYRKLKLIVALLLITYNAFQTYSQTNSEISLYTKFDSIVGKENLGLINAPYYLNLFNTIGDNTMFFVNNKFTIGTVFYDDQPYYNVKLKYDINIDQLILNPSGKPEHIGISLIQDKTESFSIYDKIFVKITKSQVSLPKFNTGYYEFIKIEKNFNLYIKHYKDNLKVIKDDGVYYSFQEKNQYYIEYESKFYEINNKTSILKIFPSNKKKINTFYQKNYSLSKSDYTQFIKNLMISINDFSINNTK